VVIISHKDVDPLYVATCCDRHGRLFFTYSRRLRCVVNSTRVTPCNYFATRCRHYPIVGCVLTVLLGIADGLDEKLSFRSQMTRSSLACWLAMRECRFRSSSTADLITSELPLLSLLQHAVDVLTRVIVLLTCVNVAIKQWSLTVHSSSL